MLLKNSLCKYDTILADELEKTYLRLLTQYKCRNWQYFGNEVGQFNELIYRVVESQASGKFTPLSDKIKPLNEGILQRWENSQLCSDESFRIIIPRVLYSMFCLRNKRGMVHKNEISPNEMDSNILLANVKWILCELIRKSENLDFEEAYQQILDINTKEVDLLWNVNGRTKILGNINAKDKVLLLLYEKNAQRDSDLQTAIEYKNKSIFVKLLNDLHKLSLIDYTEHICIISPLGIKHIEKVIVNQRKKEQ